MMKWNRDQRELILVCRQLSVMLKAGITLGDGLIILSKQGKASGFSEDMQRALRLIVRRLQGGNSFSSGLILSKDVFPQPMIAAVAAGERSGILQEVLEEQAESISRSYQSREKLKTAMYYPLFLLGAAVIVVAIMLWIVLPIFAALFQEMHAVLPLPTRIVLHISDVVQRYAGVIIIGIIITGYVFSRYFYDRQIVLHRLVLKIPLIGRLLHRLDMQRWLDTLSMILAGGVPLVDSLHISADVLENAYIRNRLLNVEAQIKKGSTFSAAIRHSDCMQGFILELISAGEVSGELPHMLAEAADLCQIESDNLLRRLEALAEPIVILFIGLVTGGLVLSILLPVMDLMTNYV